MGTDSDEVHVLMAQVTFSSDNETETDEDNDN